jgi:hypothetical protein
MARYAEKPRRFIGSGVSQENENMASFEIISDIVDIEVIATS